MRKTHVLFFWYNVYGCFAQVLCTMCVPGVGGDQKRAQDSLGLVTYRQQRAAMWVLGIESGSFKRTASALNIREVSQPLMVCLSSEEVIQISLLNYQCLTPTPHPIPIFGEKKVLGLFTICFPSSGNCPRGIYKLILFLLVGTIHNKKI